MSSKDFVFSVSPFSCPSCLEYLHPRVPILLKLRRYISHVLTYLHSGKRMATNKTQTTLSLYQFINSVQFEVGRQWCDHILCMVLTPFSILWNWLQLGPEAKHNTWQHNNQAIEQSNNQAIKQPSHQTSTHPPINRSNTYSHTVYFKAATGGTVQACTRGLLRFFWLILTTANWMKKDSVTQTQQQN